MGCRSHSDAATAQHIQSQWVSAPPLCAHIERCKSARNFSVWRSRDADFYSYASGRRVLFAARTKWSNFSSQRRGLLMRAWLPLAFYTTIAVYQCVVWYGKQLFGTTASSWEVKGAWSNIRTRLAEIYLTIHTASVEWGFWDTIAALDTCGWWFHFALWYWFWLAFTDMRHLIIFLYLMYTLNGMLLSVMILHANCNFWC
jgi:hypothetical protein